MSTADGQTAQDVEAKTGQIESGYNYRRSGMVLPPRCVFTVEFYQGLEFNFIYIPTTTLGIKISGLSAKVVTVGRVIIDFFFKLITEHLISFRIRWTSE